MICNYCGREIPDESRVCGYCGQKLDMPEAPALEPVELPIEAIEPAYPDTTDAPQENPADVPSDVSTDEAPPKEELVDISAPREQPSFYEGTKNPQHTAEMPEGFVPPVDDGTTPPIAQPVPMPAPPSDEHKGKKNQIVIPKMDKRIRPVKTAGFFWSEFLLLIPVVNLVLLFIWAFRRRTNLNRKAFARSILIWIVIAMVLVLAAFIAMLIAGVPIELNYWLVQLKEAVNAIPTY